MNVSRPIADVSIERIDSLSLSPSLSTDGNIAEVITTIINRKRGKSEKEREKNTFTAGLFNSKVNQRRARVLFCRCSIARPFVRGVHWAGQWGQWGPMVAIVAPGPEKGGIVVY